jgi:hypothetical protein
MTLAESQAAERRRSPRKKSSKIIVLTWKAGEAPRRIEASTATISRFGCAIIGNESLHPGTVVQVEHDGKIQEGSVCYVLKNASTGEVELAISFPDDATQFWNESF